MFGISGSEFLLIVLVATAVIPAKNWPVVFRAIAKLVNFIREMAWKITDASESVKDRIERELPIDQLARNTMDDVLEKFRTPITKTKKSVPTKKVKTPIKKTATKTKK